jgi:protein transport protein SEC9
MKKFGFSKKGEADDDSARNALFSGRSKSKPAGSGSSNPYAQQDAPPSYSGGMTDSYRQEKTPVPAGGYSNFGSGSGSSDRYGGQGSYGSSAAYGQSKYESSNPAPASRRPGGYGGLGAVDDDDGSRDQLFGGAAQRYQQRQQEQPSYGAGSAYGSGTAYGNDTETQGGYGAYGDRQLTAEEQEEEDVTAAKQEIKFIK